MESTVGWDEMLANEQEAEGLNREIGSIKEGFSSALSGLKRPVKLMEHSKVAEGNVEIIKSAVEDPEFALANFDRLKFALNSVSGLGEKDMEKVSGAISALAPLEGLVKKHRELSERKSRIKRSLDRRPMERKMELEKEVARHEWTRDAAAKDAVDVEREIKRLENEIHLRKMEAENIILKATGKSVSVV